MCDRKAINVHASGYIVKEEDVKKYAISNINKDISDRDIEGAYDNFVKKIYSFSDI